MKQGHVINTMMKLLTVLLIFVLILPSCVAVSRDDITEDTTSPGQSLAGYCRTYDDIRFQVSLSEDQTQQVVIPLRERMVDEVEEAVEEGTLQFQLIRDTGRVYLEKQYFPYAVEGGPLEQWQTQAGTPQFTIEAAEVAGSELLVTVTSHCYFYTFDERGNQVVDHSAPHDDGGAYLDLCGYYDLIVSSGGDELAQAHAKVVPYDAYRTTFELYNEIDAITKIQNDFYVEKGSMGHTTVDGLDMQYIVIADERDSVDAWLEYTQLAETDPERVLEQMDEDKWTDLKVPIFVSSVHGNENAGTSGILDLARMLVSEKTIDRNILTGYTPAGRQQLREEMELRGTAISRLIKEDVTQVGYIRGDAEVSGNYTISAPVDLARYYTMHEERVSVADLLEDVFFVLIPTSNPEGYARSIRTTAAGYDPNRDEANQTLNEDANLMHLISRFDPLVFTEVHGRVSAMLLEPCTPPHEPNFEYDLLAEQLLRIGEVTGMGAIANNQAYNSFEIPLRDYLKVDADSPTGVRWSQTWDDMNTAYGAQYPALIGTLGITWELPAYNDTAAEQMVPQGILAQARYVQDHKETLLRNQAELFRRGVTNANSNDRLAPWYVDQYDRPAAQLKAMRPIHDGITENENFYAEAYIIPLDRKNQTNLKAAAAAMKYLARNDVKIYLSQRSFSYKNKAYPKGTLIVPMYQAKRSLAHSQLYSGVFVTAWEDLYSESFTQRPYARGYDVQEVNETQMYHYLMAIAGDAMDYCSVLDHLKTFTSQFEGEPEADVRIENSSEDAVAAVNTLLQYGKKVGMITEGERKGDFLCSYSDYKTIANDYILSVTGADAAAYTAYIIERQPQVYLAGCPEPDPADYPWTSRDSKALNYAYDSAALKKMGFARTYHSGMADVILGSGVLEADELMAVQTGTPYLGWGSEAAAGSQLDKLLGQDAAERTALTYGMDLLSRVKYPKETMVNVTYVREEDDLLYQYGGGWFSRVPDGAEVLVQGAGQMPLQGCAGIFSQELSEEFDAYNSGVQAFAYRKKGMDALFFANSLTHKAHQTDEYQFISNFIFSRSLSSKLYTEK